MAEDRRPPAASGPSAPGLGELLEEAVAAVARARAALAAGEVPDLQATASLVDRALAVLGEATAEQLPSARLKLLGLLDADRVEKGYVVRMPKAYPMYDATYKDNVETLRTWLREVAANVFPVGRNGMHRYNNQDHSMYTAMLTVENIVNGTDHDVWEVNVEAEYHEEIDEPAR